MDQAAIERLLHAGQLAVDDLLTRSPFDDLEEILELLKRCRPIEEVRADRVESQFKCPECGTSLRSNTLTAGF